MSKPLQRIAVILPIALLVVMIGRAEWQLEHSQTWHFAIRGYDPRDLLRGHYLRFNLAVQATGTSEACGISDPDCCYCLSEGPQLEANATVAEAYDWAADDRFAVLLAGCGSSSPRRTGR